VRLPPVYAITDRAASGLEDHAAIARRLFSVGVRCLQVREKSLPDRALLEAADTVAALGIACGARVLVNDRVDVVRLVGRGTGVHLGEDDLPADAARAILPPEAPIGVSTHGPEAAARAFALESADYVAFGPVFESPTKTVRPARGLDALARVAAVKTKPLVAIGGISLERLDAVWDAGADSAAMIGALYSGGRIEENARAALDRARRRQPPRRIFLVGFMASGKSTVGRRLAERLGLAFVDVDAEIERTSGRTIRAIFEESGEGAFREREAAFLEGTASLPGALVATGGGAFAQEGVRRTIARLGTSVLLDVSLDTVRGRLAGKTDRPLFQSVEQLAGLFAERAPFYRMADVRVSLSGVETVEETADRVLTALEDHRSITAPIADPD
jgi:thiamine-phosphate diphosphorylase